MPFPDTPSPGRDAVALPYAAAHHASFFNNPPPYFLSSPIETLQMYSLSSNTESSDAPQPSINELNNRDATTTPTPQIPAATTTATITERFSPEEEERLLAAARLQRSSGNTLFATSHYLTAIDAYALALASTPTYLTHETSILHSNLAACHLQLSAPTLALSHADQAIAQRPDWAKPRLRRCRAREMLGSWKELETAVAEYEELLSTTTAMTAMTDAEETMCRHGLERCRKMLEEAKTREVGEAMKGLRGLGDGLLGLFGMSTGDFGMKPDGKGGYSLEIKRGG